MPAQDTSQLKERIISIIKLKGPSLPVHIARETGLSILFASAFLSELLSEKKLKITHLRVGSSPVYFIPSQENRLEKFSSNLNNKEREAFEKLKEKRFLKDKEQEPAIRVALRSIKDFSIPLEKNSELYWRYFLVPEKEFQEERIPKKELKETPQIEENIQKASEPKKLDIFDKEEKISQPNNPSSIGQRKQDFVKIKKRTTKKKSQKQDGKFFNQIKKYLSENSMEMLDIEELTKSRIILKIKNKDKEELLIAYNKKRITDIDIINSNKKAEELGIKYSILSFGEPLKKLDNLIRAIKNLSNLGKLE